MAPFSKYIHVNLPRLFKSTPYAAFAAAYPAQHLQLRGLVECDHQLFATVSDPFSVCRVCSCHLVSTVSVRKTRVYSTPMLLLIDV